MRAAPLELDPALYHIEKDVPVVDTFDEIDEAWLAETLERMQHLEATGNVCPLVLGHVKQNEKGRADSETPEVGLARNWRKSDLPHLGPVILADYWIERDKLSDVREHCGRLVRWSAELWRNQKEIDPIALLGPTTPWRRLGTIQLSRGEGETPITCNRFSGGFTMPDEKKDDKDTSTKTLGYETLTKEVAELKEGLAKIMSLLSPQAAPGAAPAPTGAPEAAPEAAPAGAEPEELSDEELEKLIAELEKGGGEKKDAPQKPDEAPVQASYAQPGPTNAGPKQMSREESDELVKLREEVAVLQLSREFDRLEKAGLQWTDAEDRQADLDFAKSLPANARKTFISRIEKKYAQAPVGNRPLEAVLQAARPQNEGKQTLTDDLKTKIVAHATTNKLSFEAACKFVTGKYPHEFNG